MIIFAVESHKVFAAVHTCLHQQCGVISLEPNKVRVPKKLEDP